MRPGPALRKIALAAVALAACVPVPSHASSAGPAIYTTPVAYATAGQRIGVTAVATCDQAIPTSACTATIFYRTTVAGAPAELYATVDPSWSSLTMSRDPGINVGTATVYTFAVSLPAAIADTRGVDYIIKVSDHGASSWSPGTPAALGGGLFNGARSGAYHVYVTSPSIIAHAPVWQSAYRSAITIQAHAACSTRCSGVLFFRRTGLLQPSALTFGDPPANPAEGADVQWAQVPMNITGTIQNGTTDQYGATDYQMSADIPAAYVDTRGVDYAMRVSDGVTKAYWPGTFYNGYVAPAQGARTGWQHVTVLAPVIASHTQLTYAAAPLSSIQLSVDVACFTESCSASVQYHSFGGPVVTASMAVTAIRFVNGARVITFGYTVPGGQVLVPTFSYRFRVSDGYTNAYSPGTFYTGAYGKLDGSAAGEYTVVVP